MKNRQSVGTDAIRAAVKGHETEILDALEISWREGAPHINCPYPAHDDQNPSWRWDEKKSKAHCTCINGSHSIFDVVSATRALDFDAAKIEVARLIGRDDLICTVQGDSAARQTTDAGSLLNPPADNRADELLIAYLARRLGVTVEEVPWPSTPLAGLKALGYYDPPLSKKAKPKFVGYFPCAVFGTASADGRTHAHRIHVAPGGAGKADLGIGPTGQPREPKKSARILDGKSRAGCAVLWGEPSRAPRLLLTEGIETAAAVALAFRDELASEEVAVAAAISATGLEFFQPYPATERVTVFADRDEAIKPSGQPGSCRGEQAARKFALQHHQRITIDIVLPGCSGETVDWLDALRSDGAATLQLAASTMAGEFVPTAAELEARSKAQIDAGEVREIAETYPLPRMDNLELEYARTAAGKIKVHKVVGVETDPVTGLARRQLIPVATPFGIPARLRHADQQDAHGLRCVVQDMNGRTRAVDFERADLAKLNAAEIRAKLLAAGLRTELDGEQLALQCLRAADPEREIVVYDRPGWHDVTGADAPLFICPSGEVVGAPEGVSPELSTSVRLDLGIAVAGTFEGWREAVSVATSVSGCPHWLLGSCAAFVGPVSEITGFDTCGINLSGRSSSGKSTAQRLAVSAWSTPDTKRPGLAQSARATTNAMEALAQRASGTVLSLDELALVTGKELAPAIYMLAGGAGKQRLKSDATLRVSYRWSTFAVLSAECSLEEKIRSEGGEWRGGMAVRIADIDVSEVDRRVEAATLRQIDRINQNYGHAGPAFVRALITRGLHREAHALRDRITATAHSLAGDDADSATARAAIPFALLLIAGELAKVFELLPAQTDVVNAVQWAWDRFRQSSEALALDPEEQSIANLRRHIAELWDVTIKSVDALEPHREQVGWYDKDTVYIPKDRIFEAAGKVLKASNIGPALARRRLLSRQPESDRYYIRFVPKIGRVACYALRRDEFGRSESGEADEMALGEAAE